MSNLERAAKRLTDEIELLAKKMQTQKNAAHRDTLGRANFVSDRARAASTELGSILSDLKTLKSALEKADTPRS